jgi:hypothetical protein
MKIARAQEDGDDNEDALIESKIRDLLEMESQQSKFLAGATKSLLSSKLGFTRNQLETILEIAMRNQLDLN